MANRNPIAKSADNYIRYRKSASSQDLYRTSRQRPQKRPTIRFRHDPIVQNNDDAAVGLRSD
jgi:hypothetical protein